MLSTLATALPTRICFNSLCKEVVNESPTVRRKGWRTRTGEIAQLCIRCSCAFEQGSFCEIFHSDDAGWRNCESCGKRLHCGCIASAPNYVLLDVGGVECIACARKYLPTAPNQMMASSSCAQQQASDSRELPAKNWRPTIGSFSGQWRQSPNMWNLTGAQSDMQQRLSLEFDRPPIMEKLIPGIRQSSVAHEKKNDESSNKVTSNSLKNSPRDIPVNGNAPFESVSNVGTYHREEGTANALHDDRIGSNDPGSTRRNGLPDTCLTSSSFANLEVDPYVNSESSSSPKEPQAPLLNGLGAPCSSSNGSEDPACRFHSNQLLNQLAAPMSKQLYAQGTLNADLQAKLHNDTPDVHRGVWTQQISQHVHRNTDNDMQLISGNSNSMITPLFEKMLSASDCGRVGRLVLPKKCAEAYFPAISQAEGLPLKVLDDLGKEWVFQFRYWPNNNSRMYVLEGVTAWVSSMQLQAGDTVTFSRIDPEGKLLMGFKKATNALTEQMGNCCATPLVDTKTPTKEKSGSVTLQGNMEMKYTINSLEEASSSQVTKSGFKEKDAPSYRSLQSPIKRKNNNLGSKIRRLCMENEDSLELKLTWEEAQALLRPPNQEPNVVVMDGHEFEAYQEAPIIGRQTYFTRNQYGETYLWAQCEDCSKWRKLPMDAVIQFRWTCSENIWDADRSSCSAAQELNLDQLADTVSSGVPRKAKIQKQDGTTEVSNGLGTLADAAILSEDVNSTNSQQTTRHPRHKSGCSCIICIQPPSGKGPKHKESCTCNVCASFKRRFKTMLLRREKRLSEKEAESARKQQHQQLQQTAASSDSPQHPKIDTIATFSDQGIINPQTTLNLIATSTEGSVHVRASLSPLKTPQIDLNIQPEQEEELSPR